MVMNTFFATFIAIKSVFDFITGTKNDTSISSSVTSAEVDSHTNRTNDLTAKKIDLKDKCPRKIKRKLQKSSSGSPFNKKPKPKKNTSTKNDELRPEEAIWIESPKELIFDRILGQGAFGKVLLSNDLTVGTTIPLYADDAKCYREIRESEDNRILQNDLFQIQTWSELWGMGFNTNKCKHLCVTRRRNPLDFTYHIGKHELAKVTQEKDLGVMMNSKLTWHDHVINKVATANKILCIIKRSLGRNNTHTDIIRRLYIHLVRPHLEFASEVWSPHQIFLKDMLEAVQRRATRLMVKNKPYKERLQELNLLSLTSRREYLDLVFLYKCMHNYVDSELPNYLELYDLSKCVYQLRNKKLTFKSISARTNSFKFSFFPRVATAWNDLPLDIRECASLSEFKSKLKKYYIVVDSDKVFDR
ncbi:uncharacterized protein [Montipora capricornis]|uniref:uncharacterized protein n=1 Tax=Montipora capricornis TaxID=246305 RepID=UPI0035F105FB